MDQLQAMRVFARVVESGSITRAADSLSMPKTTASKLIKSLEARLGVKLLQRTTRRVTVTADGAAYFARTAHLVRELDEVDSVFGNANTKPRGKIRVDLGASLATNVLIPALPDFHARFPDIAIEMGVSDRPIDLIRENVDCVIRGGPLRDLSLVARTLGAAAWVTCATPDYLRRHGTPMVPADLARHALVNYVSARTGRIVPPTFRSGDGDAAIEGNAFISVNDSNAHLAAGLAGLGIIQSIAYTVAPYLADGRLVPVLQAWQPAAYPFHVVYPANRQMSQRVKVFIDWLVARGADWD